MLYYWLIFLFSSIASDITSHPLRRVSPQHLSFFGGNSIHLFNPFSTLVAVLLYILILLILILSIPFSIRFCLACNKSPNSYLSHVEANLFASTGDPCLLCAVTQLSPSGRELSGSGDLCRLVLLLLALRMINILRLCQCATCDPSIYAPPRDLPPPLIPRMRLDLRRQKRIPYFMYRGIGIDSS